MHHILSLETGGKLWTAPIPEDIHVRVPSL
jgi:hypothetical protein